MTLESALSGKMNLNLHLDNEFIFLAQFIRFYKKRVAEEDEERCFAWLQRLLAPTRDGTTRVVRNTYLAELLLAMQSGYLGGPFAKKPEEGPLSTSALHSSPDVGAVGEPPWLDTVVNAPAPASGEDDTDQRMYIATQAHPDGKSAYAYLAVSTTDHDHWIEPLAPSDNESAVNVTPPRSYAAPTACNSCASVYPIREDIQLPCPRNIKEGHFKTRNQDGGSSAEDEDTGRCPYSTDPLFRFYDEILELVQSVQCTGWCSDYGFIADLLHRMKEQQATDPALLGMSEEELQLELLGRLRKKLLTRKEQARKLTRSEWRSNEQPSINEVPEDCALDLEIALDDELWESAARRKLSPTNMMLLESVYPPELVSRFVKALVRERCSLVSRMRAEHQVLVTSMRNDVQKDIEESLDKFREARALWVLLLSATQELQHIRHYEMPSASEAEKGVAIRETIREIQEAMMALDGEGKRGTDLADQLVSEQQELYKMEKESERRMRQLLAHNEALRMSLETVEAHDASQLRRINELQRQLREKT